MSLLRLAERVMGEGEVFRAGERLTCVAYELSLYGEYLVKDGSLALAGQVVEGHVHASPDALEALLGLTAPLTLHLEDGRRCDVYLLNTEGTITSADDRGCYWP